MADEILKSVDMTDDESVKNIDFSKYPQIKDDSTESLTKELTSRTFKKLSSNALIDTESSITETNDGIVVDLVQFYTKILVPKDGSAIRYLDDPNKSECSQSSYVRVLILLKRGLLQCDDLAFALLNRKEDYDDFLQEVLDNVGTLMSIGATTINKDIRQLFKASYNRACTLGLKSLEKKLRSILFVLDTYFDNGSDLNLDELYYSAMGAVNIVDAIRATNDKAKLIDILGLNIDRKYDVPEIRLIGIGSYTLQGEEGRSSTHWLFFKLNDPNKVMYITTIRSYLFITNTTFMDTQVELAQLQYSALQAWNVTITNDRITNTEKAEGNKLYDIKLEEYLKTYACKDLNELRERASARSANYFGTSGLNVFLLKCSDFKDYQPADKEHANPRFVIVDSNGEEEQFELVDRYENPDSFKKLLEEAQQNKVKLNDAGRASDEACFLLTVLCEKKLGVLRYTALCPLVLSNESMGLPPDPDVKDENGEEDDSKKKSKKQK